MYPTFSGSWSQSNPEGKLATIIVDRLGHFPTWSGRSDKCRNAPKPNKPRSTPNFWLLSLIREVRKQLSADVIRSKTNTMVWIATQNDLVSAKLTNWLPVRMACKSPTFLISQRLRGLTVS